MRTKESRLQKWIVDTTIKGMARSLDCNYDLMKKLTPTYAIGCRRPSPASGYLEALQELNCTPVFGEIAGAAGTGLVGESGEHFELGAVICAAGFDVSYRPY